MYQTHSRTHSELGERAHHRPDSKSVEARSPITPKERFTAPADRTNTPKGESVVPATGFTTEGRKRGTSNRTEGTYPNGAYNPSPIPRVMNVYTPPEHEHKSWLGRDPDRSLIRHHYTMSSDI